jgi:hypothetical protein
VFQNIYSKEKMKTRRRNMRVEREKMDTKRFFFPPLLFFFTP